MVDGSGNGRLDDITALIVERFEPAKVILFGSVAEGTDGPDSDLDLWWCSMTLRSISASGVDGRHYDGRPGPWICPGTSS